MGTMDNKERDIFSVKQKKYDAKKRKKLKDVNPKEAKRPKKATPSKKITADLPLLSPLTYETLVEGQIIFGCIREVHEFELVVSLPHRIVGYVPITNISKAYTKLLSKVADNEDVDEGVYALEDLYSPGQFITTQVKKISKINNKTKVVLTFEPRHVNSDIRGQPLREGLLMQCACKSTEDNGYILETGLPSVHGAFLPKSEAPKHIGIGSIFLCRILSVADDDEGQISLKLTANLDKYEGVLNDVKQKTFSPFPGDVVDASIKKLVPEGLLLNLNGCDGIVSNIHLAKPFDDTSKYQVGQNVKGRVLFVSLLSRVVHLSVNHALCDIGKIVGPSLKVGDTIDSAKVYKSSKSSVHFKLPGKNFGFCSSNQLKDGRFSTSYIKKTFPVGTVKQCRILQFSLVDQMYIVSLKKSLIQEKVLGMQNLEVGKVHTVVIKEHIPAGAIVAVSQHLDGFVPKMHLTDSNMANPELKLPIGKSVRGRVLRMEPGKRLHFTLKSLLVDSELPILKGVTNDLAGTFVEGSVAKISLKGLLVEFYNEMKGFVPKKYIAVETLDDLTAAFKLGQVVKCQVLKIYQDDGIMLTMIDLNAWKQKCKEQKEEQKKIVAESVKPSANEKIRKNRIGNLIDCTVKSVDMDKKVIHAIRDGSNIAIEIPMFHLSDNPGLSHSLFISLKKGDKIERAIIFRVLQDKVVITLKPSIRQWADTKTKASHRVNKIKQGDVFPCVVDNIEDSKLDVRSAFGKFGLINPLYKSHIANLSSFIDISKLNIEEGQTLIVKCLRLPLKWKAVLSAKFQDVLVSIQDSSFQFLLDYLLDMKLIKEGYISKGGSYRQFAEFSIGEIVKLEVKKIASPGILGLIENTAIKGIIRGRKLSKQTSIGSRVKAKVVFVNFENGFLELSSVDVSKRLSSSASHGLDVGDTGSATIVFIKPEFIMAKMLKGDPGQVVYLPSKRHLNDFSPMSKCFIPGQIYKVVIKYVADELILADILEDKSDSDCSLDLSCVRPSIHFEEASQTDSNDINNGKSGFSGEIIKRLHSKHPKKVPISMRHALPQLDGLVKFSKSVEQANKVGEKNKKVSQVEEKESLTLKNEKGFTWKADEVLEEETSQHGQSTSESDDEEEEMPLASKSSPKKTPSKIAVNRLKDPNYVPKSAEEFENFLEDSPKSSSMWIKYAKYYLKMSEENNAIDVLRRGLPSCSHCTEKEQVQLWKMLLSIEEPLGSKSDLATLVEEASSSGGLPPVPIHLSLAELYIDSNKLKEAEGVFSNLMQKHPEEVDVWVRSCAFHFEYGRLDESRKIFDRALTKLPKDKIIHLITNYAKLEFTFGYPEKAIAVYESLVNNFPKKLDVWNSYLDTMKHFNKIDSARGVLERMGQLKLPLSDMRTVFLQMQQFESEFGTPDTLASVKRKAANYIASLV